MLLNFNVAPRSSVLLGTVERSSVTCIRRHSTVVRMCVSPRLFSWVWLNYVQPEQFTTAIAIKTLLYGRIKPLSFTHTSILELMNVSRGNKWSKQPIILMWTFTSLIRMTSNLVQDSVFTTLNHQSMQSTSIFCKTDHIFTSYPTLMDPHDVLWTLLQDIRHSLHWTRRTCLQNWGWSTWTHQILDSWLQPKDDLDRKIIYLDFETYLQGRKNTALSDENFDAIEPPLHPYLLPSGSIEPCLPCQILF